jgi:hypothetical protein
MVKFMIQPFGPDEIFFGILFLSSILGYSQAKLCALLSPNGQTAFVYYALLISCEMILSGFLIFPKDAPIYLKWTMDLIFSRWAVYGLLYNQFNNYKETSEFANGMQSYQGELVLKYYGLSSYDLPRSIWILVIYLVGLELMVMYSMLPKTNKLRRYSSLTDSSIHLDVEDPHGPAVVTATPLYSESSQSLQIDLISDDPTRTSTRNAQSISSAIFNRISLSSLSVVSQLTSHLIEPYDKIPSQQHPPGSEGRVDPRQPSYTEPRETCRVSDILEPKTRAELIFKNVSYQVQNSKGKEIKLLQGVTGIVKSGELCAIMGSSGAGTRGLTFLHYCPSLICRQDHTPQRLIWSC